MAKKPPKPEISPPAPFENMSEVEAGAVDTPDIQAFRAFNPNTTMLKSSLDSQFENARRNVTDSYGAYSGIPSHVARNRLRDEGLADLEEGRGLALAEGNERAQALKMAQLEATANLTGRTKSKTQNKGFNTQVIGPQQGHSNLAGSIISGGAGIATAAIIA